MKYIMPVRKQLGIRTIFNIVGPLTNPAGAQYQVIGVFRKNLCETMAEALREMRVTNALIVHGEDGMDEITLTGTTLYAHLHNGNIRIGKIDPEQLGFRLCNPKNLLGGNPADNARILLDILEKKDTGPRRDIVILNSGAAFWISGKVKNLKEAIELARHSIDSGAALQKLQELQDFSNN
jgi:anthranilate phosphoribosyltransferase